MAEDVEASRQLPAIRSRNETLADALTALAYDFDYGEISTLVRQAEEVGESE